MNAIDVLKAVAFGGGSGGGGGGYTETLLWENPNPAAELPQTILYPQESLQEFAYLKIEWKEQTTSTRLYKKWSDLYESNGAVFGGGAGVCSGSFARPVSVYRSADGALNRIIVEACKEIGAANTQNGKCVPVAIYGIKKG